ncbi:acetate--CoA ligase family protein [Marinospirillum alkaliphilum]|uniref:Acetyltransferase n=1 Tax=Marinospirillum alkaliphilum DSM 21637 TaxID=1122209 RepID=A0A1K1XKZ0_9GAMM|nr:acetate--CoA ligase family protein [Marinospirillum alkaliphilum]SFX50370.1 acetyltransferase [Marinospirillum alkaliphilum DSM 21637]
MSTRFLRYFFEPRTLAVIGASEKNFSLGGQVVVNLLDAAFPGRVWVVNPKGYIRVHGCECYAHVRDLPEVPDLAVVCTPADVAPDVVAELGRFGVKAALVLTSGQGHRRTNYKVRLLEAAQSSGIRVMGPECMGILVPSRKLNASYAPQNIKPGKVAYIGQSGMLGNAIIDWANGRGIGFSHLITLGDSVDVRLADVIDYINRFSNAQAILLHLENVPDSRHFMTAVREASRNKLVLAIKSGRTAEAQGDPDLYTPGLINRDPVYDAAFSRAGMVRVHNSEELFDALETLTRMRPVRGDKLAIVSNGLGPSMLAVDRLIHQGGQLAPLTEATRERLRAWLPSDEHRINPLDIGGGATPQQFVDAIQIVSEDPEVDAVLVVHAPTRLAPSEATALAVIANKKSYKRNLLTSWMGLDHAFPARHEFNLAGIPTYLSPEKAVQAFMHLVNYQRNQLLLQETPPTLPFETSQEARNQVRQLVESVVAEGRLHLSHEETAQLLKAYAIDMAPTFYPKTPEQAGLLAKQIEGSKALKINHATNSCPFVYRKHPHKVSAGLLHDLETPEDVRLGAEKLLAKVQEKFPHSPVHSFVLQPMQRGKHSMQLNLGITRDPVFGPVILFGIGGYKVNILLDRQIALPPLNMTLAQDLVKRSHAGRLIQEHSNHPEQDLERIGVLLVKLSQLCSDIPLIRGLEINPLLLNRREMFAIDVQCDLGDPAYHAIMPYPEDLRKKVALKDGREVEVRPIRGEDAVALLRFHSRLSEESIRFRYFHNKADLTKRDLSLLTQINYDRQMAFIAEQTLEDGSKEILGVSRVWTDPDNIRTEFSVIIRDDLQGLGLGSLLMNKLISYSRSVGTLEMVGKIMVENHPMRGLMKHLGFQCTYNLDEQVIDAVLPLNEPTTEWQRHRLANPVD